MPVWQGQGLSVKRNANQTRPKIVSQEECQSGKAKVRQSVGMPVWQGQGSSINRNASLARPRFVNQEGCQYGKAKVRQSVGVPVWQGQGLSLRRNASLARPSELYLIVIFHFSIGKAAMSAPHL
jgi:hypothetical protein